MARPRLVIIGVSLGQLWYARPAPWVVTFGTKDATKGGIPVRRRPAVEVPQVLGRAATKGTSRACVADRPLLVDEVERV